MASRTSISADMKFGSSVKLNRIEDLSNVSIEGRFGHGYIGQKLNFHNPFIENTL
jgi:hypothetical protein